MESDRVFSSLICHFQPYSLISNATRGILSHGTVHGNAFSVIISPKHANRQLRALPSPPPPCGALARPAFVLNPSLVFIAPTMNDVFRIPRRFEPPRLSRRGLVCNSFITNPTRLLCAGFRLWESSYHCLPGSGYGCRATVILGSLIWNALSLIRFFFSLQTTVENPIG